MNIKHKTLAVIGTIGMATAAQGAGLDRSGQDVTAFLQDGTYAEAVYTYIDADVSGYDNAANGGISAEDGYVQGKATGDIAEAYDFFRFGVKADINDRYSVGVLYDEPFGAAIQHFGDSNFNAQNANATISAMTNGRITSQAALARAAAAGLVTASNAQTIGAVARLNAQNEGQGTNVEIRTNNATLLLGRKFNFGKNHWQVYGGPSAQRLTGEVHLRGIAYNRATGYDAKISPDHGLGFLAGVMYGRPEIALKASLTYRSRIKHKSDVMETFPALALAGGTASVTQDFSVSFPESYNLDFQTGVSPTMLLTAKARYVPWSKFTIDPALYKATTQTSIVDYSKDQWQAEIGLGKKLNDKISVSGSIGYDSGAGNPVSTLGPIKGYYSVGLGAKYNLTPEWSVSLGGKYLKFGDATAQLPTRHVVAKFSDNDGYIVGLKLAYQKK
ncbi:MAG: hypothetical protein D8B60_02850 [Moraxella sp.]|nr:MAG: hypothetical protein D8B60_02850 [Moraxella sp.]